MDYSYQEFLNIANHYSTVVKHPELSGNYTSEKRRPNEDIIMEAWLDAGQDPTVFVALELILEEVFPAITYLQYRKLCRTLIKYGYYVKGAGNALINMDYKYIYLTDLYDYLLRLDCRPV
jgi:hypothetical protein